MSVQAPLTPRLLQYIPGCIDPVEPTMRWRPRHYRITELKWGSYLPAHQTITSFVWSWVASGARAATASNIW